MTTYQNDSEPKLNWEPILKPAEIIETRLIKAILTNTFPINSNLPGERELSDSLGVTRPTLREALQRLERDGWIEIHQGKPTRVRDYWKEGRLGVLNSLALHLDYLPNNFVPNLLAVRLAMAPMYTALAVDNAPEQVINYLKETLFLEDSPDKYSRFDWDLQCKLSLLSDNPIFAMILNSFEELYLKLAPYYFSIPEARQRSLTYYRDLTTAAKQNNIELTTSLTEEVMQDSIKFWQQIDFL